MGSEQSEAAVSQCCSGVVDNPAVRESHSQTVRVRFDSISPHWIITSMISASV
jgi:hypothetical protein